MQYHLSIKDIAKDTGLAEWFIRDIHKNSPDLFDQYRSKGGKSGKYLYSNNALIVFRKVSDLKKEGLSKDEIIDDLHENNLPKNISSNQKRTTKSIESNRNLDLRTELEKKFEEREAKLEKHHREIIQLKEELYESKFSEIKSNLKLLTDGKDIAQAIIDHNKVKENLQEALKESEAAKKEAQKTREELLSKEKIVKLQEELLSWQKKGIFTFKKKENIRKLEKEIASLR